MRHAGRRRPSDIEQATLFIVGSGGGGHKAAAAAVRDCLLSARGGTWRSSLHVELVDAGALAQEALGGPNGDDVYNWLLQNGCYWLAEGLGQIAAMGQSLVRSSLESAFEELWREWRPAVVVSFVPFANLPMRASLGRACPESILVTVITDLTSTSAHPWIDPWDGSAWNHIIVAGTAELMAHAAELGYKKSALRTSGMVVHPAFYEASVAAAPAVSDMALDIEGSTLRGTKVVVYFGGQPPSRAEMVAKSLLKTLPGWTVVVLCGRNEDLFNCLRGQHEEALSAGDALDQEDVAQSKGHDLRELMVDCIPEGFLGPGELAAHLASAAFVVGKPGPGAVSEASVCGVPFVCESRNAMTQEVPVLGWLQASRAGVVVDDLESLPDDLLGRVEACNAVLREARDHTLAAGAEQSSHREHVVKNLEKRRPNRAVFEVTEYLQKYLLSPEKKLADWRRCDPDHSISAASSSPSHSFSYGQREQHAET